MYLYDTRYNNNTISRFPIEGWIFPCWRCGEITSNTTVIFYNKKILYIPNCRHCKYSDIASNLIYKHKIIYINN